MDVYFDLALNSDEADHLRQLDLLDRRLKRQAALSRTLLRPTQHDTIRLDALIHLTDRETMTELQQRCHQLEDRWLLGRHSLTITEAERTDLERRRRAAIDALAAATTFVSVEIGRIPPLGALSSGRGADRALRRRAVEVATSMRADASRLVRDAIDADLFDLELVNSSAQPCELWVIDTSPETLSRVRGFVTELNRLGELNDHLIERVRFQYSRARPGDVERTDRLGAALGRRAEAQRSLDALRAFHSAVAEVEQACSREQ